MKIRGIRSEPKPLSASDLIFHALPFGRLWYGEPNAVSNAIGYAKHRSRSHDGVIRVYDEAGNLIETHEHTGRFQRVLGLICLKFANQSKAT